MDQELVRLLERTPGIVCTRHGIVQNKIDPKDWVPLLTMQNPSQILKSGEWVKVKRGKYQGDAGLVVAMKNWGVEVLLLPRLNPPAIDNSTKRKRSTVIPTPALFDPIEYRRTRGVDPKKIGDRLYSVGQLIFDQGLLRKGYDFCSLSSPAVDMPSQHILLYETSGHPAIRSSTLPHPREWIFEEGDKVLILPRHEKGVVSAIGVNHLEINFAAQKGIEAVLWRNVRKDFELGDFVQVTSGSLIGMTGWIIRIDEETVHVMDKAEGDIVGSDTMKVRSIQ